MAKKQDRHGVRTATDIERKYNLGQSVTQAYVQSTVKSAVAVATNEFKGYADVVASEALRDAEDAKVAAQNASTAAQSANSAAQNANATAEEAQDAVEELRRDLSVINAGGRNLLRDSDKPHSSSEYHLVSYFLGHSIPVEGETYTLRLKGQLGEGKEYFWVFNSGSSVELSTLTDNGDGTHSATFAWTNTKGTKVVEPDHVSIFAYPQSAVSTSTIEWIKLEEGSNATSWTPAPEDKEVSELLVSVEADSLTTENLTSDKTFAEIEEAILSGQNVRVKLTCVGVDHHIYLQLTSHLQGSEIAFCGYFNNLPLVLKIMAE